MKMLKNALFIGGLAWFIGFNSCDEKKEVECQKGIIKKEAFYPDGGFGSHDEYRAKVLLDNGEEIEVGESFTHARHIDFNYDVNDSVYVRKQRGCYHICD